MLEPGTIVLDKYRIIRTLGAGGMGVVALVYHLQLERRMAMKFLQPSVVGQPDVVQRFLREARAAAKLDGEHICRVFDVGVLENGSPYMLMEYLEGMDLGAFLKRHGSPPMPLCLVIMRQACQALAQAHTMGVVHRDVKPANLFLTQPPDGGLRIKLLDFGISKAAHMDVDLTSTQTTLGTPAYMSPEQLRSSKDVDERTDIWSLGVVLYELVSGSRPFAGDSFSALCLQIAMESPPPLSASLPPVLQATLSRCLQKDPDARFQSVAELDVALADATRHLGGANPRSSALHEVPRDLPWFGRARTSIPAPGPDDTGRPQPTTLSASAGHVAAPSKPRYQLRGWHMAVTVCLLLGLGGTYAWTALRESGQGPPTAPAVQGETRPVPVPEVPLPGGGPGDEQVLAAPATEPDIEIETHDRPVPDAAFEMHPVEMHSVDMHPADMHPAEMHSATPEIVRYRIDTEPSGARVSLRGERIGKTPLDVDVPTDEARHYRLTLRGYLGARVSLPDDANTDGNALVRLQRREEAEPREDRRPRILDTGDTLKW